MCEECGRMWTAGAEKESESHSGYLLENVLGREGLAVQLRLVLRYVHVHMRKSDARACMRDSAATPAHC